MGRGYEQFQFDVHAFTPTTLPTSRLAEYVRDLAVIFGHGESVHFLRVDEGSANSIIAVEPQSIAKIERRLIGVRDRVGPSVALRAYESLDRKLEQDAAIAFLRGGTSGIVIPFARRNRPKQELVDAVSEIGQVEGELVQIGGRDESISVYLRDGDREYICYASRAQGKELAKHIFSKIRLSGRGIWSRDADAKWNLDRFDVERFQPLTDEPLSETVARLRLIPRPEIDPITLLASLSNGEGPT